MLSTISYILVFAALLGCTVITVLAIRQRDEACDAYDAEALLNEDLLEAQHAYKMAVSKEHAETVRLEARCLRLFDDSAQLRHALDRRDETIATLVHTNKNLVASHEMMAAALEDYNIDNAKRVLGGEFVPECADSLGDYALDVPLFSD
jgi:hypothetical protein